MGAFQLCKAARHISFCMYPSIPHAELQKHFQRVHVCAQLSVAPSTMESDRSSLAFLVSVHYILIRREGVSWVLAAFPLTTWPCAELISFRRIRTGFGPRRTHDIVASETVYLSKYNVVFQEFG